MEICSINLWFSVDIRLHPDIYKVVYRNVGGEFPGNKDSDPNKRVASHCVVYKPSHVGRLCGAFRGSRLAVGGQQHWSHWMWFDLLWSTSWFRKPPEAGTRWRRAGASCSLKTLTYLHLWPHFRRGNTNVNIADTQEGIWWSRDPDGASDQQNLQEFKDRFISVF